MAAFGQASSILGIFTSAYSEPRRGLTSLGGEVGSRIHASMIEDDDDAMGKQSIGVNDVFSPVDEYGSTGLFEDYRVVYIANTSNTNGNINSVALSLKVDYVNYLDKTTRFHLDNINLRVFVPPYGGVRYVHPVITESGVMRESGVRIGDVIRQESTPRTFGRSVIFPVSLGARDFFPIVLYRSLVGPLPHLRNYKFIMDIRFTAN